ncbi:hypothetical protein LT699_10960 [Pseudomonas syringae pv. syringae]|uniref:hypothetical protein n=1 Tax=Pseudomonas syringae TaxID=317 RepID=UPI002009FE98|nr:hypothetical protein [Pseudomonas syringae]MCK9747113.1 hypothetical protein [Pseudomonas syringae pv. syringae]
MSEDSPHPVYGDEDIAACASHPYHSTQDGTITHKVFDRAFTQGLSVTRLGIQRLEEVLAFCAKIDTKKKAKNPDRHSELRSLGTLILKAQQVRDVKFPICHSFAFRVYDTARPADRAHADIVGTKYFGNSENLDKKVEPLRNHVQLLLTKRMDTVSS